MVVQAGVPPPLRKSLIGQVSKKPTPAPPVIYPYHPDGKTSEPGAPPDPADLSRRLNRYLVEQKLKDSRRRSREAARKDISSRKTPNLATAARLANSSSIDDPSTSTENLGEDQMVYSSWQKGVERDHTNHDSEILSLEALTYLSQLISTTSDQPNLEADSTREKSNLGVDSAREPNRSFRPSSVQSLRQGAVGRRCQRPKSVMFQRPTSIQSNARLNLQRIQPQRNSSLNPSQTKRDSSVNPLQSPQIRDSASWPESPGDSPWESDVSTLNADSLAKKKLSQKQRQSGLRSTNEWAQKDDSLVEAKRFKFRIRPLFGKSDKAKLALINALDHYSHETSENTSDNQGDEEAGNEKAGNEIRYHKHKPNFFLALFKRHHNAGK